MFKKILPLLQTSTIKNIVFQSGLRWLNSEAGGPRVGRAGGLRTLMTDVFVPVLESENIYSLVTSHLYYGNALYLNPPEFLMLRLQWAQTSATCLILKFPPSSSVSHHLSKLHWLPVKKCFPFKALCLANRALYNPGPAPLKSMFTTYCSACNLRSSLPKLDKTSLIMKSRTDS